MDLRKEDIVAAGSTISEYIVLSVEQFWKLLSRKRKRKIIWELEVCDISIPISISSAVAILEKGVLDKGTE
jgi:hypothetical protein